MFRPAAYVDEDPPIASTSGKESHSVPFQCIGELKAHQGTITSIRFNSDGSYCMSCGRDRSIILWNPTKRLRIKTYTGHGYEVRDVSISRDHARFCSVGGDRQVFHWDVSTGAVIRKYQGHDHRINAVRFAAEDTVIVSGGDDKCIKLWDTRSHSTAVMQSIQPFADSVTSIAIPGDGSGTGPMGGDREGSQVQRMRMGVGMPPSSSSSSPLSRAEIIAASVDGTIRRLDIRMGLLITDTIHHPIVSLALTQDAACYLAACLDATLRLLDRETGRVLQTFRGHRNTSVSLQCALYGGDRVALCGSEDGDLVGWDVLSGREVGRVATGHGAVVALAARPGGGSVNDGVGVVTGGTDGMMRLWGGGGGGI